MRTRIEYLLPFFTFFFITTTSYGSTVLQVGALDLIMQSGLVAKLVLLALVLASVFSWAIILTKRASIREANQTTEMFLKAFWQGQDLEEIYQRCDQFQKSPVSQVFKSGFKELKKLSQNASADGKASLLHHPSSLENINRALNRATMVEVAELEKRVGNLATIASAAPFVGLFGTVWGIMNSFQGIGASGSANLAVVAPGISEALITTAAGLAAAIPAVVAYNHLSGKIRSIALMIDSFNQDFLNLIQRNLLK